MFETAGTSRCDSQYLERQILLFAELTWVSHETSRPRLFILWPEMRRSWKNCNKISPITWNIKILPLTDIRDFFRDAWPDSESVVYPLYRLAAVPRALLDLQLWTASTCQYRKEKYVTGTLAWQVLRVLQCWLVGPVDTAAHFYTCVQMYGQGETRTSWRSKLEDDFSPILK